MPAANKAEARRAWLASLNVGDAVEYRKAPNGKPETVTITRVAQFVFWLSNGKFYGANSGNITAGTIRPLQGKP
jgi:hypothetical protein